MRETLQCPGSLGFNHSLPVRSGSYKSSACGTVTQFISPWAYPVLSFQTSTRDCFSVDLRVSGHAGYKAIDCVQAPSFICVVISGGKNLEYILLLGYFAYL